MKSTYGALFAALLCAGPASAVSLSARGQGQMLIYPYYTTANSNTLISLTNNAREAKVVRLRVAEGEHAADALSLNIYIGPKDTWYGVLFDPGNGQTSLVSSDTTCTYPAITGAPGLPQLPDGRSYRGLHLPAQPDAGSNEPARLREGFVEALELASVIPYSATSNAIALPYEPNTRNCAALEAAWAPGGYWAGDPRRDLVNPTGGLSGESAVVNVPAGVIFGMQAVAIDDVRIDPRDQPRGTGSSVVAHTRPTPGTPPLSTLVLTDPLAKTARADVVVDGKALQLTYPAPERAFEALSAVLMTSQLSGVYEEDPAYGARTSFVLTYPTRPLYTDAGVAGSPLAPFAARFRGVMPLGDAAGYNFAVYDREGAVRLVGGTSVGCHINCPPVTRKVRGPGTAVEVLAPGGTPDPLLGSRLHADLGGQVHDNSANDEVFTIPVSGMGTLELLPSLALRPSLEGRRLVGLPVIGTRLVNYVNANASPGLLANFSLAVPMSADSSCIKAGDEPC